MCSVFGGERFASLIEFNQVAVQADAPFALRLGLG